MLITHFFETTTRFAENSENNSQLNIIDNIPVSKYWGTKTVFHTIDFCPQRFFCWSFKTKAVSCDNIQTTPRKTFMSKCDINFFEITLTPHSCLLGNFSIAVGVCSWYLFVVMTFILCIDLFQWINLRTSLPA